MTEHPPAPLLHAIPVDAPLALHHTDRLPCCGITWGALLDAGGTATRDASAVTCPGPGGLTAERAEQIDAAHRGPAYRSTDLVVRSGSTSDGLLHALRSTIQLNRIPAGTPVGVVPVDRNPVEYALRMHWSVPAGSPSVLDPDPAWTVADEDQLRDRSAREYFGADFPALADGIINDNHPKFAALVAFRAGWHRGAGAGAVAGEPPAPEVYLSDGYLDDAETWTPPPGTLDDPARLALERIDRVLGNEGALSAHGVGRIRGLMFEGLRTRPRGPYSAPAGDQPTTEVRTAPAPLLDGLTPDEYHEFRAWVAAGKPTTGPDGITPGPAPDPEARAHPLHAVLADVLATSGGGTPALPTVTVWGRHTTRPDVGVAGTSWVGSPAQLADRLVRAISANSPRIGTLALVPLLPSDVDDDAVSERPGHVIRWQGMADAIATVLLDHLAVALSDTGPIDHCACGHLQLGQSWTTHVAAVLTAVVAGPSQVAEAERLEEEAAVHTRTAAALRRAATTRRALSPRPAGPITVDQTNRTTTDVGRSVARHLDRDLAARRTSPGIRVPSSVAPRFEAQFTHTAPATQPTPDGVDPVRLAREASALAHGVAASLDAAPSGRLWQPAGSTGDAAVRGLVVGDGNADSLHRLAAYVLDTLGDTSRAGEPGMAAPAREDGQP